MVVRPETRVFHLSAAQYQFGCILYVFAVRTVTGTRCHACVERVFVLLDRTFLPGTRAQWYKLSHNMIPKSINCLFCLVNLPLR